MDGTLLTNIIIGVIGIVLTLATFFITYKLTIGARKEREKNAYREIISTITRFIAQNQINPTLDVIQGLIRSKAREYNVSMGNIPGIPVIFEDSMTKFIENEFISQDIKKDLINKVSSLQTELESKETRGMIAETIEVSGTDKSRILLSTITSMVVLITLLYMLEEYSLYVLTDIVLYAILAMSFIFIATVYLYMNANIEKEKKESESTTYISPIFENMVFSVLQRHLKEKIEKGVVLKNGKRIDFALQINDERIPIEVKYQDVKPNTIEQIFDYKNQLGAERALLITNSSVTERARKSADAKNIIIVDNVNSEEDLINSLKEINIIEG